MDIEIVKNIFDSSAVLMAFIFILSKLLDKTKFEKIFERLSTFSFGVCLCVFIISALVLIWMK